MIERPNTSGKIDGTQSRWVTASVQGENVVIVCGADIIALRKIEVESTQTAGDGVYYRA